MDATKCKKAVPRELDSVDHWVGPHNTEKHLMNHSKNFSVKITETETKVMT